MLKRHYNFWNTSNTSLGNLGFKIIEGRLLIEDLRYFEKAGAKCSIAYETSFYQTSVKQRT